MLRYLEKVLHLTVCEVQLSLDVHGRILTILSEMDNKRVMQKA